MSLVVAVQSTVHGNGLHCACEFYTHPEDRNPNGAGPVRRLLGGKGLTGRFLQVRNQSSFRIVPRPRFLVNSELLLRPNRSR